MHVVFCDELDGDGAQHHWAWITDHRSEPLTAAIIANQGGRLRWKIENVGLNSLKNGEFELKHDYGSKGNSWHNTWLIVQVVHLLVQLVQHGDQIRKLSGGMYASFRDAYSTFKSFIARLRESVHRDVTSPYDITGIHVKFNTS
jgi:hypothetical protein